MGYVTGIYLNPGDKVWYIIRDYQGDMIVECTVKETSDVYDVEGLPGAVWAYRHLDPEHDHVSVPTKELNEGGWNIHKKEPLTWLEGKKPCNQFLWIDEPVGHGIMLGDECFLTLAEAMKAARPSSKKHLRQRLVASRRDTHKFIVSTWKRAGEKHPGFKKLPLKKIYIRRSR